MEIKELSLNELTSLWQNSWGEKLPSSRLPAGQTRLGFYPIDRFKVAFDEGKPVSFRGWSETNGYTMLGMDYTKEEYRRQGLHKKLAPPMRGKIIVGLSQKDESFSPEAWANTFERQGFVVNPTDEEIIEVFGETSPTTDAFRGFYSGGTKSFAIKNMDSLRKNERWIRVMGKNGFNIMDTKYNKPVNRTGLSKSRAKAMLEAIKRGETDLTQYEGEVKRKSRRQWKTILRKILPDDSFETAIDTEGNELISPFYGDNNRPYDYSSMHNIMLRPHYGDKLEERFTDHPDYSIEHMENIAVKLQENKSYSPYGWFYINDDPKDFAYITFETRREDTFYAGKEKSKERPSVDQTIRFTKPSVNTYIFDSIRGGTEDMGQPIEQKYDKFHDLWGTGKKEGHLEGNSKEDMLQREKDRKRKEREKKESDKKEKERLERIKANKERAEKLEQNPTMKRGAERSKLIARLEEEIDGKVTVRVNTRKTPRRRFTFSFTSAMKRLKKLQEDTSPDEEDEVEIKYLLEFTKKKKKTITRLKEQLEEINEQVKSNKGLGVKIPVWKALLRR